MQWRHIGGVGKLCLAGPAAPFYLLHAAGISWYSLPHREGIDRKRAETDGTMVVGLDEALTALEESLRDLTDKEKDGWPRRHYH